MKIPSLREFFTNHSPIIPTTAAIAYSITCNGQHVGMVHTDYDEAAWRMADLNKRYPDDTRRLVPLVPYRG